MKKYMILLLIGLLAACSGNDVPLQPEDNWLPVVSRTDAASAAKEYLVSLKYGNTSSSGVLITGAASTGWKGSKPVWPADNQSVDVLALHPALADMPAELGDDAVYLMHYSQTDRNHKPAQLAMHHLMAQIKVQILVRQKEAYAPQDGIVRMRRKGTIRYGAGMNGGVPYLDAAPHEVVERTLGTFAQTSGTVAGNSGWNECMFENQPVTVVPQSFQAGADCLTFWVNDVLYVFKPEHEISLVPGKINILKLGVTYTEPEVKDDEDEGSGSGTGAPIPTVELQGITVADWLDGGAIGGGEAEEK